MSIFLRVAVVSLVISLLAHTSLSRLLGCMLRQLTYSALVYPTPIVVFSMRKYVNSLVCRRPRLSRLSRTLYSKAAFSIGCRECPCFPVAIHCTHVRLPWHEQAYLNHTLRTQKCHLLVFAELSFESHVIPGYNWQSQWWSDGVFIRMWDMPWPGSFPAGSLDSSTPDMIPLTTDIANRADCRHTISSLLRSLRVIYGLQHVSARGASGGLVVLSREGERWRRLLQESDLVRLWNDEHATYVWHEMLKPVMADLVLASWQWHLHCFWNCCFYTLTWQYVRLCCPCSSKWYAYASFIMGITVWPHKRIFVYSLHDFLLYSATENKSHGCIWACCTIRRQIFFWQYETR